MTLREDLEVKERQIQVLEGAVAELSAENKHLLEENKLMREAIMQCNMLIGKQELELKELRQDDREPPVNEEVPF